MKLKDTIVNIPSLCISDIIARKDLDYQRHMATNKIITKV